jgi:O-antigen ligase
LSLVLLLLQMAPNLVDVLAGHFSRTNDPTEISSLSGRAQIWEHSWELITKNPILGYGYNSTKELLGTYKGFADYLSVDSAHNVYLQSLLSVGILGTIPFVIVLGYLTYRMVKRPIPFVCYMIVTVLISGMTDTDAIAYTPTLMTMLFFVASVWPGLEGLPVTNARQAAGISSVRERHRTLST